MRARDMHVSSLTLAAPPAERTAVRTAAPAAAPTTAPSATLHAQLHAAVTVRVPLTDRQREALQRWLGMGAPLHSLDGISRALGVSRERARQLRNRAWARVRMDCAWARALPRRLAPLLEGRTSPLFLDRIADEDPWFAGFESSPEMLGRTLEGLATGEVHAWPLDGRLVATAGEGGRWLPLVERAREALAREIAIGVSRSAAQLLVRGLANGEGMPEFAAHLWAALEPELHFARTPDGGERLLSIGRGLRRVVRVILQEAPHPLPLRAIVQRLAERGIAPADSARFPLAVRHAIADAGGVLFGRRTYGLEQHMQLTAADVAQVTEEVERLVAAGAPGRQWHATELVAELVAHRPAWKEALDPYVVSIILRRSSRLTALGRLIWMGTGGRERAGERARARGRARARERRRVAVLCEAALEAAGGPLTSRELRAAVAQVRGLPPRFVPRPTARMVCLARGRWGLADRDVAGTGDAQRAALDTLHQALERRGTALHLSEITAAVAEHVEGAPLPLAAWELIGLARHDARFHLGRGQLVGLRAWGELRRPTIPQAFAQLAAAWDGARDGAAMYDAVNARLGRTITRQSFTVNATRAGFAYDEGTGRWDLADRRGKARTAAQAG